MDLGCRGAEVSQACAEAHATAARQNLRIRRAWACVADAETILAKEFAAARDCLGGAETFIARLPDLLARGLRGLPATARSQTSPGRSCAMARRTRRRLVWFEEDAGYSSSAGGRSRYRQGSQSSG